MFNKDFFILKKEDTEARLGRWFERVDVDAVGKNGGKLDVETGVTWGWVIG